MRVHFLNKENAEEWDDFVFNVREATVYHTYAWLSFIVETFGYKNISFFLKSDGGEIQGCLPLFELKGLFGRKLDSAPFRDRGAILARNNTVVKELIKYGKQICQEKSADLIIKQGNLLAEETVKSLGLHLHSFWQTTEVNLNQGVEDIWNHLKNNAVGPVKQARKMSVFIREGKSLEDMNCFYRIFLQTRKRLGIPSFPEKFFRNLWNFLNDKGFVKLFLAEKDGSPIAGIILLLFHGRIIDGYAASLPNSRNLRPNDLLIWEAIKYGAENDYEVFDFGADSPKQKGLLAFKRKWTGVHKSMNYYSYSPSGDSVVMEKDSSDSRYKCVRKVISKMPMPLFRGFSNIIVPFLT